MNAYSSIAMTMSTIIAKKYCFTFATIGLGIGGIVSSVISSISFVHIPSMPLHISSYFAEVKSSAMPHMQSGTA